MATSCLLEKVVGVAAYQGLSRRSRVEITPWLFPNQLYRPGLDLPGPAKDLNTSLHVYDDGWWGRRMAHGYGKGKGRERNEKAFLERTTAGWRQPSKDRGKMEHGLDGMIRQREEEFEFFAMGTIGEKDGEEDSNFLRWW
jgi:hypothetical protein